MSKKSNNSLRQRNDETRVQIKEKEYLIQTGIDEEMAEEMVRTKKRTKNRKNRGGEN